MKAMYDVGDFTPKTEVDIIAWDRNKHFYFVQDGVLRADKCWKFDVKWSNKFSRLPEHYNYRPKTNKEVVQEIKQKRQVTIKYTAFDADVNRYDFNSLKKALNFCKSNAKIDFLVAERSGKYSWENSTLLEKVGGEWLYNAGQAFVSEKTLNKFCMES